MAQRTDPVLEEAIAKAYAEGKSSPQIAREHGLSRQTVLRIVRRTGGVVRPSSAHALSSSEEVKVLKAYQMGTSGHEIARRLKISPNTVYEIIRRNHGSVRPSRKYTLNDRFFDEIDSERKAYWLGFLAADGYIFKHQLSLYLQAKDRAHIQKFLNDLDSNYPIRKRAIYPDRSRKAYGVTISSPRLIRSLAKMGVTNCKSFTLQAPLIPPDLERHFWRGMIDGDGCITFRHDRGRLRAAIILVGTQSITSAFKGFVNGFAQSSAQPRPLKGKDIWSIAFAGVRLPQRILDELYGDASVYLDRKMDRAKEVFALEPKQSCRVKLQNKERGPECQAV